MKKFSFILIALLMGTALAMTSLELFLRLNPRFGYITTSWRISENSKLMARKRGSSLLDFENIPSFNGINSYGLVSREYKLKKDSNTFRILILGDSVGEGFDNDFFENLLNTDSFLHSNYNFEVWNGSVGAYDIRQYWLYLKYKGLYYKPDMVIAFLCLNDFDVDTTVNYLNEKGNIQYRFSIRSDFLRKHKPSPFLMRYSYLYRLIVLKLNTYLLNSSQKARGGNLREESGEYYLTAIKEICENKNLPFFAAIFPYLKPFHEYKDDEIHQYQSILRVVKKLNINYIDFHKLVPDNELYSLRIVRDDQVHPKDEKSRPFGKIIYTYLLDNFFKLK